MKTKRTTQKEKAVLVARVKRRLQRAVSALESWQQRLQETARLLPPPEEADQELDLNQMDETTELRMVILCVSHDSLRPAIADLRAVAEGRADD